jgi:hypothetical protein
MAMSKRRDLAAVVGKFRINGEFLGASPYGSGHINDSCCISFRRESTPVRYILQRINSCIFKDPIALMENIQRVTAHLGAKVSGERDADRVSLTLIPTREGEACYSDTDGSYWRVYRFIEDAHSYNAVESPDQAFQAAKAFGHFQRLLVDLPAPRLHNTIADFHDTPKRFAALEGAIASDAAGRAILATREIEFAFARKSIAGLLLAANLPERITHNDTKLNNVLLDNASGEGICVVDLDTVMPGLALYDFGDMVRTMTSSAKEDERDLSKVVVQVRLFEAVARGYLASAGGFLTEAEKQHLVLSGKLMTFEQGVRFLTDYLVGDAYYKVSRNEHNLDRCRAQFKLLESIEEQEERMERLVESLDD